MKKEKRKKEGEKSADKNIANTEGHIKFSDSVNRRKINLL
jgi:hypothetical protein